MVAGRPGALVAGAQQWRAAAGDALSQADGVLGSSDDRGGAPKCTSDRRHAIAAVPDPGMERARIPRPAGRDRIQLALFGPLDPADLDRDRADAGRNHYVGPD